ncbi:MAG: hypothetical protein ACLR6B_16220 [Blautia sp.]
MKKAENFTLPCFFLPLPFVPYPVIRISAQVRQKLRKPPFPFPKNFWPR